eukprot:scaffold22395_cov119-Skeletonema_marinoi.AAC.3
MEHKYCTKRLLYKLNLDNSTQQQAINGDIADSSLIAFLAQSVERTTLNRVVVGSIPTEGDNGTSLLNLPPMMSCRAAASEDEMRMKVAIISAWCGRACDTTEGRIAMVSGLTWNGSKRQEMSPPLLVKIVRRTYISSFNF